MRRPRIALLNFPLDNNYGGNLQRYALMTVLQYLGYDVTHLCTMFFGQEAKISLIKLVKFYIKLFLGKINKDNYPLWRKQRQYLQQLNHILPFYNKYVKHTSPIYDDTHFPNSGYDVYMVGSDQVWRRSMSGQFTYSSMFLDFAESGKKKIAYGVSFGNDTNELTNNEIQEMGVLYNCFNAVSVREDFALKMLNEYGWTSPQAVLVLDPTLLLSVEHYCNMIDKAKTSCVAGDLFCYVLDMDEDKKRTIEFVSGTMHYKPYYCGLDENSTGIEQWLRNIRDAKYVVTDSYHGMLLSILFNRPFELLANERRGIGRFTSMLRMLNIEPKQKEYDWNAINSILQRQRSFSMDFLINALL